MPQAEHQLSSSTDRESPAISATSTYLPQLDGLRCLAIAAVVAQHYFPPALVGGVLWGRLGVRLFFVISGFLITSILLRSKQAEMMRGCQAVGRIAGRFYMRRALRLTPAFYLALVTLAIFIEGVRSDLGWHLAYLSNINQALPTSQSRMIAPFWSLAVEEQYYLLWPWAILLLPRSWLAAILGLAIVAAPAYRLIGISRGWSHAIVQWQLFSCMDSLAMGSLLALAMVWKIPKQVLNRIEAGLLIVGLPLLIYCYSRPPLDSSLTVLGDTGCALVFVVLVHHASRGMRGWVGRALEHPVPVFLGKISYGIYIYHATIPLLWNQAIAPRWGLSPVVPSTDVGTGAIYTLASIAIAYASWRLLEVRFLSLKRLFR